MKVPGYIEGPYGRFPPYTKKHRATSTDRMEIESDLAESGSEAPRSRMRNNVLRPGRAERVVVHETMKERKEYSKGDNRLIPVAVETAAQFSEYSKTPNEVSDLYAGPRKGNEETGLTKTDLLDAPKHLDVDMNLLHDAIDGHESLCNPPEPSITTLEITIAEEPKIQPPRPLTFFSKMPSSFTHITPDSQNYIPTLAFLDVCHGIPKILDLMGGRVFSPVKADLNGNITKLRKHFYAAPDLTATIQEMVLRERNDPSPPTPSAIEALLWLKRSLTFMDVFLGELLATEKETSECAHKAYTSSLQAHHSFMVRTAFRAALYTLPRRKDFVLALAEGKENAEDPLFIEALLEDARDYSSALQRVVEVLNAFYVSEKLD